MNGVNPEFTIEPTREGDRSEWLTMWAEYCSSLEASVPDAITETTWQRLLDPASVISGIIVCDAHGKALGFANYVLHPHTWSAKTVCYLEDLYVRSEARSHGVGHSLIEHLIALGRQHDWKRVYWHTETGNVAARRLYDRFKPADDYVRYTVSVAP